MKVELPASQLNVWLDDYAAGLELAGRSSANAGLAEASRLRAIEVRAFMARRSDETGPSNDQLVAIIDTFGQTCFDCGLIRDARGADPEPARIAQQAARLAVHVALDLKDSRRGYGPPLQTGAVIPEMEAMKAASDTFFSKYAPEKS